MDQNQINILVCDDDKEIAGAVEIYLRNEGYRVFKAYDGIQALEIAGKETLHLIIMDIMMPRMDGVQATMKLREEQNIPIIMLSAKSEDYDKITGLNVGADDYAFYPAGADCQSQITAQTLCTARQHFGAERKPQRHLRCGRTGD